MVKFIEKRMKQDKIINLTDSGKHNNMRVRVVRDLQDDGTYRLRQVNWDGSLIAEENYQDPNSIGAAEGNVQHHQLFIAHEDKGSSYPESYQPPDPEPLYEEQLEATGATIIKSETYYPKSGITTNKRSMTHDEFADERGYLFR